MRRRTLFTILLMAPLITTSCASAPTKEELAKADCGAYPEHAVDVIKAYQARILKDPSSAIYGRFAKPQTVWFDGGLFGPRQYGYRVCYEYNAKNSYGGYVGQQTAAVLIRDDQVIRNVTNELKLAVAGGADYSTLCSW